MCGILAYVGAELSEAALEKNFELVGPRGPDFSTVQRVSDDVVLGFHRLAIMDPTPAGNQPFELNGASLVCNGEIYNYKDLAEKYGFPLTTGSDCEVILHMFHRFGIRRTCEELDGVFGFAIRDGEKLYVARDPIGIRGLFIGLRATMEAELEWLVSSEMKGIHTHCDQIEPFKPGHFAVIDVKERTMELDPFYTYEYPLNYDDDEEQIMATLRAKLIAGTDKRMMSDRPIGCLVSGGVDSSLVAALVARHYSPGNLHTFTVGLDTGASDRGYARMVADYIGSVHHEVSLSRADALELIKETVRVCESFDTTTIRASTMQLALAKYISEHTEIKVVFNGDVIDEASGSYVYFKNAPSAAAYQEESVRLMREIHLFDVLRTDRTISGCGLEARLPFGDLEFLQYYMAIPPEHRAPRDGVEKYLLRKAFEGFLPEEVLWRPKEAFSDGCSQPTESWYTIIQNFVEDLVSDEEFENHGFDHCPPQTKEQYYYRKIFEDHYPGRAQTIPHFWMPRWCGDDVIDPSARVLTDVYRPSDDAVVEHETAHRVRDELATDRPMDPNRFSETG